MYMEDELSCLFTSLCADKINAFSARHCLDLPQDLTVDKRDLTLAEAILTLAFDAHPDDKLLALSHELNNEFGAYGSALDPYLCQFGPGLHGVDDGLFGSWTLHDFKKSLLVGR